MKGACRPVAARRERAWRRVRADRSGPRGVFVGGLSRDGTDGAPSQRGITPDLRVRVADGLEVHYDVKVVLVGVSTYADTNSAAAARGAAVNSRARRVVSEYERHARRIDERCAGTHAGGKWLRELTVEEGTVHAELDGGEIRTLMKVGDDEVYPPAAFMDEAVKHFLASSGLRNAAIVKWSHKAFGTLVMVRAVTELVWPARQSLDMQQVEHLRDVVLEVFPWAFNVVFEDDYEWPESGQTQTAASKRDVVVRVIWVELTLRLGLAARRGRERLVQYFLPKPPEDGDEAAARLTIVDRDTENARRDLGVDVARAYGKAREAATKLNTEEDTAEFRRRKMYKSLAVRWMKRMRNDVAADEEHVLPELVQLRANAISDVRRRNVMVVDDRGARATTEEIVALSSRSKLSALHGTLRSPSELVLCEANVGEEIVRQMCDAVDLVAKQPHVDAVKGFAVKSMSAIGSDAAGAAGTQYETFNTIVATLSPVAKDYAKPDNQFSVEMAKQLAWIRSKNATDMMAVLNERMTECVARGVPGTVTRDGDTASPTRARARTDAAAAAAHAVIDGAALGVPMLPGEDEGAGVPAPAPPERGTDEAAAPMPAAAATDGAVPADVPAAATESVAPGLPPAPPPMMMPPPYNPMMMQNGVSQYLGGLAPGMPTMMPPGLSVPGGNPMMNPAAMG